MTKLPEGAQDRFWYWRGASGRKYLHTIYAWGDCPPLPGAVYVAVKRIGKIRTATAVRRFPSMWDEAFEAFQKLSADEVHIHLLAKSSASADHVLADLAKGLEPDLYDVETIAAFRLIA